jgi:hypothetical protein
MNKDQYIDVLRGSLKLIRGDEAVEDSDGLIEDATCVYCGESIGLDGCNEDCPRSVAAMVLALPMPTDEVELLPKVKGQTR